MSDSRQRTLQEGAESLASQQEVCAGCVHAAAGLFLCFLSLRLGSIYIDQEGQLI